MPAGQIESEANEGNGLTEAQSRLARGSLLDMPLEAAMYHVSERVACQWFGLLCMRLGGPQCYKAT